MHICKVNLSKSSVELNVVDQFLVNQYIGGLGLGVRMMSDYDLRLPALDPNLPLIVTIGCLTDTGFPGANRACFLGVSPLTGLTAGSWLGGDFSTGLARTGIMALMLEGEANQPTVVVLNENKVELVSRPDLWGKTVSETQNILNDEYPDSQNVVIGPAGEKLAPIANIRGNEGHAAGRCGLGAIMGSKKVKAIVAGGGKRPTVANPKGMKAIIQEARQCIRESGFLMEVQGPIGTASLVQPVNEFHAFPTANHKERYYEEAKNIYGNKIAKEFLVKRTTCPTCPVRCRHHVNIDGEIFEGAEYETIWAFGGDNLNYDYSLIVKANNLCNDLGMDTISTGNTIAFYREYAGMMNDPSNMLELIKKIGYRDGEGDILSQGTRKAARQFGVDYAMQVKGLELAAYDPRKLTGMALSYSTANRGGCHSRCWTVADELTGKDFSAQELAEMVVEYHNAGCLRDSLIMCTFIDGEVKALYPRALNAALGVSYTDDDLKHLGDRIYTMERYLNVKRGVNKSQDILPKRILEGLVYPDKYKEGMAIYYNLRKWDENGCPSSEKMSELGLDFLI